MFFWFGVRLGGGGRIRVFFFLGLGSGIEFVTILFYKGFYSFVRFVLCLGLCVYIFREILNIMEIFGKE